MDQNNSLPPYAQGLASPQVIASHLIEKFSPRLRRGMMVYNLQSLCGSVNMYMSCGCCLPVCGLFFNFLDGAFWKIEVLHFFSGLFVSIAS